MKTTTKLLGLLLIITMPLLAQTKKGNQMEKRVINPWKWQNERSYNQAVEVKNPQGT